MKLINLTPHSLTVLRADGSAVTLPPSGTVARCTVTGARVGEIGGIVLTRTSVGIVTDMPAPAEGVMYVVSLVVRTALPGRTDIASPGELVRGPDGQPVGCRGLAVN